MPTKLEVTVGDYRATEEEIANVTQVLRTGRLSYGPFSRKLEADWAAAHGAKHAVFCNSGTSALQIALQALKLSRGWDDGDEVIVPAVTFVATSNIVLHNNLKPVFVDVEPDTYNIDATRIEKALSKKTRCIIPVHLCGLPADMEAITALAHNYNLAVIEDSCETTFARCQGKPVGSWGDIGCFSTYMAHYVVTGVGGLCTTSDPDLAVRLRSLMNHGRDSIYLSIDDDNGLSGAQQKEMIAKRFRFVDTGHSFRCTEMEAAIGVCQVARRKEIVAARTRIARRYTDGLADLADVLQLPAYPTDRDNVFMMYPLVTRNGSKRELVEFLESRGIETRDLLPLLGQPVYLKMFGDLLSENPVAARLDTNGFYIGCHQHITDEAIEHVISACYEFYGRGRRSKYQAGSIQ